MAKKWVNQVIDISRVKDRIIVIKVLVQKIFISVYASQRGLDDSGKDDFYESIINSVRTLGEKEITGYFNGHVKSNPETYEEQHGGYGYGVRNKDGKRILEFCASKNMTEWNALFKKRASHL